jgi:hypothetical protein
MRKITLTITIALSALGFGAAPAGAQFLANRTFVSGRGSDSNGTASCSLTAPCRSFAVALQVTKSGGEIVVLDPAGYGTVTITKAVSIINDAVGEARITDSVANTNAITIAAGPTDVVNLRGLTLTGVPGGGSNGIAFTSGGALNIQNCVIRGFANTGISFVPTVSSTLTVFDTIVSDIGGSVAAIFLQPVGSGLTVNAYLGQVQVIGNAQHGIDANTSGMTGGSLHVTVADSVATGNANGSGILMPTASSPIVTVINTRLTNNQVGLNAGQGTAYIAETTISGNTGNGFIQRPFATVSSFGNNRITDTNNAGSLTPIAKQ